MQPTEYPKWVVLQLVDSCNLRCSMCYEWGERGSYHHAKPARLDIDVIRQVINDCAPGRPFFELFGGEPLLHPQISEVVKLIGETGCVLGIPTNGTLLTDLTDVLVGDTPIRLWVSLDGPEEINDRQRGRGVFKSAMEGLDALYTARAARGCSFPQLGITCVVTATNCDHLEQFFLKSIDLEKLDFVIIALQNFATRKECDAYETVVRQVFGGSSAAYARGYERDVSDFSGMDFGYVTEQITRIRQACRDKSVLFFSHPMTIDAKNLSSYFGARWHELTERRSRCAFPWMYAEISARGDVTTCHSMYDITVGNVYEQGILDIWNGEQITRMREHLRHRLFPICTSCCRYFNNPTSAVLRGVHAPKGATSFEGQPFLPDFGTQGPGEK